MSGRNHKNHHYLPRGILKSFGSGKKNHQIFFINKQWEPVATKTNIKNIACINHFYDFELKDESLEVDYFGDIDNKAPKLIKKLLADIHRPALDSNDRKNLSLYVASQITRVPYLYKDMDSITTAYAKQISDKVDVFNGSVKDSFLRSVVETTKIYQEMLSNLSLIVFQAKQNEFVIGDNPVIILEHDDRAISRGNHAFAVVGKVFMMPISPREVLIYFDSSFKNKLNDYALSNNFWQFVKSSEYVFGHNEELLVDGLKEHYKYSYDYIKMSKPSLIDESDLKRGNPVYIGQASFAFDGKALEKLQKQAEQIIYNKAIQPTPQRG